MSAWCRAGKENYSGDSAGIRRIAKVASGWGKISGGFLA